MKNAPDRGRGGLPLVCTELRPAQIVVGGLVQVHESPLNKNHQGRRREGLGGRGDRIERLGEGLDLLFQAGQSEGLFPDDLAVLDDGERKRRNRFLPNQAQNLFSDLRKRTGPVL